MKSIMNIFRQTISKLTETDFTHVGSQSGPPPDFQHGSEQRRCDIKVEMETDQEAEKKSSKYKILVKRDSKPECSTSSKKLVPKSNAIKKHTDFELHIQNLRTIMRCSNATPLRLHGRWYTCCCCPEQFEDTSALKKHTADQHPEGRNAFFGRDIAQLMIRLDITGLECKLCAAKIDRIDKLMDHLKNSHSQTIHTFDRNYMVPFRFDTGQELKCVICDHEFINFKTLVHHMNTHIPNFVCNICASGFVNQRSLQNHVRQHANGEHKCETCQRVFNNDLKLKEHEKSIHLGLNKRNKCDYCEERFNGTIAKNSHMVKVHGKPAIEVRCPACDKPFKSYKYLAIHKRTFHMMEKRHKCPECDKMFFSTPEVKNHMLTHTGQRDFLCVICSKAYGRKSTLREHMRIHADDRRFKCEHCDMTFVQKCSWRGHVRSKHGEEV